MTLIFPHRSGCVVPSVEIESAGAYLDAMASSGIMVDFSERKSSIWAQAQNLARSRQGLVSEAMQSDLLSEVANLVEHPTPILGSFQEKFLRLPKEVLVTVMRKHQRYFPVEDEATGK